MKKEKKFIEIIKAQIKLKKISHAYLVLGSIDIEKLQFVFEVENPDLLLVEESPIKISHIRELIRWVNIKPHSSNRKLVILKKTETITIDAANCLLKILEEPPAGNILVLQSSKKEKILPTIISRCQIIKEIPDQFQDIPEDYLHPEKIIKISVQERFKYIDDILKKDNLYKKENLINIINLWEEYYRNKMLKGEESSEILNEISKTRSLLSTNTSVKFLLENLVLNF